MPSDVLAYLQGLDLEFLSSIAVMALAVLFTAWIVHGDLREVDDE
jgi:hypothetical protein